VTGAAKHAGGEDNDEQAKNESKDGGAEQSYK